jgi:hypothetical protein
MPGQARHDRKVNFSIKVSEKVIYRYLDCGAVIAVQTFGGFLGFNPHCHILVTDGCF